MENLAYLTALDSAKSENSFKKAFRLLLEKSLTGNPVAVSRLGYCHGDGIFLPRSAEKELYYYLESYHKEKHGSTLKNIALAYKEKGDIRGASYFWRQSLKGAFFNEDFSLACLYNISGSNTVLVKRLLQRFIARSVVFGAFFYEEKDAKRFLKKLEQGDTKFKLRAVCINWGKNRKGYHFDESKLPDLKKIHAKFARALMHYEYQNYKRAITILKELSSKFHYPKAMDLLGYMYCHGVGLSRDIDKSIEWYQKAIHVGYAKSLLHLAQAYRTTLELDKYHDVLQEAVNADDMKAHLLLANLYSVICKDQRETFDLLNKVIQSDEATIDLHYEAEHLLATLPLANSELDALETFLEHEQSEGKYEYKAHCGVAPR